MILKNKITLLAVFVCFTFSFAQKDYKEIEWSNLEVKGYSQEDIYSRYIDRIDKTVEGSKEELELYEKMKNEFDNIPLNEKLNNAYVGIAGFIAPLNQEGKFINEFLLVPYFGACIHSPPPPSNQTIYVKVSKEYRISFDDSHLPFVVYGILQTSDKNTSIGNARYSILDGRTKPYMDKTNQ